MKRIKLELLKQSTTIPIDQLKQLTSCNPYSQGWLSQKFPIYPILINYLITNPPFNRISISLNKPYLPSSIELQGSSDTKQYFKFHKITNFQNSKNMVINLKQAHDYSYLRIRISEMNQNIDNSNSNTNICKQISIKCIQLCYIGIYGSQYICNMQKSLNMDPCLFSLLQLLEYKALISREKHRKLGRQQYYILCQKYLKEITTIRSKIKSMGENQIKLSQQLRENLVQQFKLLQKEQTDIYQINITNYDRSTMKQNVSELQAQLSDFYVNRVNNLHQHVIDYFKKYRNKEIKQQYLRMLSSTDRDNHSKALTQFWGQIKKLQNYQLCIEQAIVMFYNYFLEQTNTDQSLKISAIKILCLLFRNQNMSYNIQSIYSRLFYNLYCQLQIIQKQQLCNVSIKCIYTLFQKVPDNIFIQSLLKYEYQTTLQVKLHKLQILQKIIYKGVSILQQDRQIIINFILDIFNNKQITLIHKNRAYNIIAYLASIYGKQYIMNKFDKLNTMITMNMQKIINTKLLFIKIPNNIQNIPSCQYCGIVKQIFKDTNLYDLHCFKQCKYLTQCKYCNQVVQIPQLYKHYIYNCQERNLFKECQNCNQVILKLKQDQHNKLCPRVFGTKCGLCGQKMQGKLKLKEHILKDGCPNNLR